MKPYQDITDPKLAKALAHPLRTRILAALEDRTASPSELATELGASLGVISYHVRRLQALGFVKLVKRVPRRGAVEHYYTATTRPRITDAAWGATPGIVKQATIKAALDQIGSYVNDAAAAGGFDAEQAHLTRSPVIVDERGFVALARALEGLTARIQEIEADSKTRLTGNDHEDERQATVVLMLFNSPSAAAPVADPGRVNRRLRSRQLADV
ncbi:MAG: ArsR/SmtB family transcription factor [Solirubrobacteraceae bacterium]